MRELALTELSLHQSFAGDKIPCMDLKEQIVRVFQPINPKLVILFGSQARGTEDELSDIDLIVVYPTSKRFLDRLEELYALWTLPYPVDILAYTPEEFETMKTESPFVEDAVRYGRVLFEAA